MTERKWRFKGKGPEGKKYFEETKKAEPKTLPEPPPAFTPEELETTTKSPPLHKPSAEGTYWWQED